MIPLLLVGCSAEIGARHTTDAPAPVAVYFADAAPATPEAGQADATPRPDATSEILLGFDSPADGASYVREEIEGDSWVARVSVELSVNAIASVQLLLDGVPAGDPLVSAPFAANLIVYSDGVKRLEAIGYDADMSEVARTSINLTFSAPSDTSCEAKLDALGIDWTPASATRGIPNPVRVQPVIRGVAYRYISRDEPTAMIMDCGLAPRLARLSDIVTEYGIDEVVHIGIYNYRCIGGGTPDSGCTPSQHAYARALDIHEFGLADSETTYNVETDWIITDGPVCSTRTRDTADQVLHEIACRMHMESLFNIVLTPNYNAAHRNHFHVDLTADSSFIGLGVSGVDPWVPNLGH